MEDNQITDNDKEDDKQDRMELVQRAVEGDKEAFTNLYTLTYSEVYHIVKVFIHNEDTAQDIVQETYYKSLRKIKQLKEPDKFPVWIKKIAVNTAKAHLRKVDWVLFSEADGEGGKSIAELQDERLEHIPEIVVDQAETKELIDQILGELDEKQRMVVGMFYYEQMSVNEIADALNCSVNTVKSRLNYARKKIGKEIAELEKKGVILRTAAPVPILMYLFQKLRGVQEQIPKAKFLVKAGIEKAIVTGIAAAAICMGIGIGAAKIPDRHQQVQEIQELLVDTDDQKNEETEASVKEDTKDTGNTEDVVTPTPENTPKPTVTSEPTTTPEPAKNQPVSPAAETESTAENNGQPTAATGSQGTEGNTENTDSTGNTESTGNQQGTSISETDQHTHQWVAQTEKIHHEASGHYETKTVQEAYEEPVYEYHVFCNTCGADVTTNAQEHEAIHNAGFSSRKIQTGSIHHDAVTQQVWVDEPAYDEVVTRGYVCSVCGAAK